MTKSLKFEEDALRALETLFARIPIARVRKVLAESEDPRIDAVIELDVGDRPYRLVCAFKANGHPRATREGIGQLQAEIRRSGADAAIFLAPYISEPARQLCIDAGVNHFDLYGNFRIHLGSLFIERTVADRPPAEKRDLKSLFKPKSARVLRWLLRAPSVPVRLQEIADGARVSLGQVHNVKEGLVAREWAETTSQGLVLTGVDGLVNAWREVYEKPTGQTRRYYTVSHGEALTAKLQAVMEKDRVEPVLALGSFSAASWLAPYGRTETTFLYAWPEVLPALEQALSLEPTAKGANLVVEVLEEESILLDAVEPVEGLIITSPIQTYLDLHASGDRGREAAEVLRRKGFAWAR